MRGIRFPHVPIKESRSQHHAFSTLKVLQCHPCSSDLTLRVRAGVFCTFRSRIRATTAPRVGRTPGSPCFTPPDSHLPGLTTSLVGLPRSCMPGHAFFSASPQTMAALLMGTFEVFLKVHNCEPMAMNTDKWHNTRRKICLKSFIPSLNLGKLSKFFRTYLPSSKGNYSCIFLSLLLRWNEIHFEWYPPLNKWSMCKLLCPSWP